MQGVFILLDDSKGIAPPKHNMYILARPKKKSLGVVTIT